MTVIRKIFLFASVLASILAGEARAFTLLSGPNEATLPVSPSEPTALFVWDGSTPVITGKESFEGGEFANLDDEEFFAELLRAAFALWNDVTGSYLAMEIDRDDEIVVDENDLINAIVVKSSENLAAAAFAVPTLSDDADVIEDCDITISDSSADASDLAYTIAHELGHCIGLGHNHTNYNAMMGYARTDTDLKLGADDKAGVIFLYTDPAYDSDNKEFLACASLGGRHSGAGALLLLLPLLLMTITRRRLH